MVENKDYGINEFLWDLKKQMDATKYSEIRDIKAALYIFVEDLGNFERDLDSLINKLDLNIDSFRDYISEPEHVEIFNNSIQSSQIDFVIGNFHTCLKQLTDYGCTIMFLLWNYIEVREKILRLADQSS